MGLIHHQVLLYECICFVLFQAQLCNSTEQLEIKKGRYGPNTMEWIRQLCYWDVESDEHGVCQCIVSMQ